jgi:hypothetical protein
MKTTTLNPFTLVVRLDCAFGIGGKLSRVMPLRSDTHT